MPAKLSALDQARADYAREMARGSGSTDPRIERIFELVPREAFLPPGPWKMTSDSLSRARDKAGAVRLAAGLIETPDADPVHLYRNALVVLDEEKGINSGEPLLHAMWIGAVAPQPGEVVTHIGAGAGYYTAILSMLVLPGGRVLAYEVDAALAGAAKRNLKPFDNVTVLRLNAVEAELEPSDIIYVNAGVVAPPVSWVKALTLGGRLIFPWRPLDRVALAIMVTRGKRGYAATVLGGAWFIPCTGASNEALSIRKPAVEAAAGVRAIVLTEDKEPDETAIAVYPGLWFSSRPPQKAVDPPKPKAH